MDVVVPFSRRLTPKAAELMRRSVTLPPSQQRPLRRRHSDQEELSRLALHRLSVETVKHMHEDINRNETTKNHHYEAMIERFQLRRLKSMPVTGSKRDLLTGTITHQNSMIQIDELVPHAPVNSARKPSAQSFSRRASHNNSFSSSRNHIVRVSVTELMSPVLRISDDKSVHDADTPEDEAERKAEARRVRKRRIMRMMRRMRNDLQCPMSPYSMTACVRHSIVFVVLVLYLLRLPMKLAFPGDYIEALNWIDCSVQTVLLIDLALNFNTAFIDEQGDLVTDRRIILWNYLTGWSLLDLLSTFQTASLILDTQVALHGWIAFLCDGAFRWMRFVHLIWIIHVLMTARARLSTKGIAAWLLYSRHSHLLRIMWILVLIMLLAHYMACIWKVLASPATALQDVGNDLDAYASSFYDALQLLHGQGLTTDTLEQNLFAAMAVLVGSVVLAVVFGHVAILVSNFNANSTNYQRKMESVFAVMTKMQLPVLLRERIHQYYEHLWREYESLDGQLIHFSKELTHTLELEVVLFKYMEVVMQIPFWHDSSPDFLKQIVLQIQVRVYLPDDYILRRGEVGDEYYIINRGICEMIRGDDSVEHATVCLFNEEIIDTTDSDGHESRKPSEKGESETRTIIEMRKDEHETRSEQGPRSSSLDSEDEYSKFLLSMGRGQSFGELALLTNYPRTSNARAITYVEMCVLRRREFQSILLRHPEDRKRVLERMLLHTMQNNEALGVGCPLLQSVRSVYAEQVDPITVATAAAIVTQAINPDREDDSIMFGIGTNLKRDLTVFREHGPIRQEMMTCPNESSARSYKSQENVTVSASAPTPSRSPVEQMNNLEVSQRELLKVLHVMRSDLLAMTHRHEFVQPGRPTISRPIPVIDYIESSLDPDVTPPPVIKPARRARQSVKRTRSAPSQALEPPNRLFKWRRRNSFSENEAPVAKNESLTLKKMAQGLRRIASDHANADAQASSSPLTDRLFQRSVVLAPIPMSSLTTQGHAYAKQKSWPSETSGSSPARSLKSAF